MDAEDVIESYVADVAMHLPRKQRADVAFELRALLNEELQAKARTAGRSADDDMATELARAFGRPAEVAARYRPPVTIIDPADGRAFLQATAIGLATIWGLGLLTRLRPIESGWDVLTVLGAWWGGIVIPSLWWPGLLVVSFGMASWARNRSPQASDWTPRAGRRSHANRAAMALGLGGILLGLYVLIEPRWLLDVVWGGRAAPGAYESLTYTDTFRQRQGPWLLVLLLLNIPLMITAIVHGGWPATMRHTSDWQSLVMCVVLVWTVLSGPVMVGADSDRFARGALAFIVAATLMGLAARVYRSVRPAVPRGD